MAPLEQLPDTIAGPPLAVPPATVAIAPAVASAAPAATAAPTPPTEGDCGSQDRALAAAAGALARVAAPGDDRFLARVRLRQQMLRWSGDEAADPALAAAEAAAVVARIRRDQAGFQHWREVAPAGSAHGLQCAGTVRPVPEAVAAAICQRFHYVGTRREGLALGLFGTAPQLALVPATLLLVSHFDLPDAGGVLPAGIGAQDLLLLSRVYTFRWAPRNAFSFCWSRALPLLRERFPGAKLAVTCLDPNPGFTATSYLAANWVRLAGEQKVEYWYLDGQHITRRELARSFGTGEPAALQARLGRRLTASRQPILPLELWAFPLRRSLRQPLLRLASMARGA